jgi:hypothetical protein
VPSFSSGEVVSKRARVQSRSSECEPEGNLDGFLARLQDLLRKRRQQDWFGNAGKEKRAVNLNLEEQHFNREAEHCRNEDPPQPECAQQ